MNPDRLDIVAKTVEKIARRITNNVHMSTLFSISSGEDVYRIHSEKSNILL